MCFSLKLESFFWYFYFSTFHFCKNPLPDFLIEANSTFKYPISYLRCWLCNYSGNAPLNCLCLLVLYVDNHHTAPLQAVNRVYQSREPAGAENL